MNEISESGDKPIGEHGTNYFYKEFVVSGYGLKSKKYQLGSFYFVQKSSDFPVAIAEIVLIWSSKSSDKKFAVSKLYLKPDNLADNTYYGKDELVEVEQCVVIECRKFPLWECSPQNWYSNTGEFIGKLPEQKPIRECLIKILSFPQYCRFQACKKRLESGVKISDKMLLALGGIKFENHQILIVFSRKCIQKENISNFSPTQDISVPQFRGRPRKKKGIQHDKCNKRFFKSVSLEEKEKKKEVLPQVETEVKNILSDNSLNTSKENTLKENITIKSNDVEVSNCLINQPSTDVNEENVNSIPSKQHSIVYPTDPNMFKKYLYAFMYNRGTPITKIPIIGYFKVNLFNLFSLVDIHGGYFEVTLKKRWRRVYELLGHSNSITNSATITRKTYENLLLPFENFLLTKNKSENFDGNKEALKDETELFENISLNKNIPENIDHNKDSFKNETGVLENISSAKNKSESFKGSKEIVKEKTGFENKKNTFNTQTKLSCKPENSFSNPYSSQNASCNQNVVNIPFPSLAKFENTHHSPENMNSVDFKSGKRYRDVYDNDSPPKKKSHNIINSSLNDCKCSAHSESVMQPSTYAYSKNKVFSNLYKKSEISSKNETNTLFKGFRNGVEYISDREPRCDARNISDSWIETFNCSAINNGFLENTQKSNCITNCSKQVYKNCNANIIGKCTDLANEKLYNNESSICGSSLIPNEDINLDDHLQFVNSPFQYSHQKQPVTFYTGSSSFRTYSGYK